MTIAITIFLILNKFRIIMSGAQETFEALSHFYIIKNNSLTLVIKY